MKHHIVAGLSAAVLLVLPLSAVEIPAGGTSMSDPATLKAMVPAAVGTVEKLPGNAGNPGGWRIAVTRPDPAQASAAQCVVACPVGALAVEDLALVVVKARAGSGAQATVTAKLQLAGPPYTEAGDTKSFDLFANWDEYAFPIKIKSAIPEGKACLTLFCGQQAQTVEVADIRVVRYGPRFDAAKLPRLHRSYAGREPDAAWRKEALARIEQIRKLDMQVRVTDQSGKPVAHAPVSLSLRRHAFGFGSATPASFYSDDSENGKKFRGIVERYFSTVVFENDLKDFWWAHSEPEQARNQRRAQLDRAITWLQDRHIAIRGHYLMQVTMPSNLEHVTDAQAVRRHLLDTTRERIAFAGDRVCEWDAINHPVGWGAELLTSRPGLESIDRDILKLARSLTKLPLWVNEDQIFRPGHQSDGTHDYLAKLKQDGFAIGGLGNQAHIDESYLPAPAHVFAVTDRFASVVPHQMITEFDVMAEDETLAADYTRDLLIACFSHPAYTGFLWWGFWEGSHWRPEAASWNRDWSIRKRGEVIEEWLGRRWHTEVTVTTDANGVAKWRGFPGWYDAKLPAAASAPAGFSAGAAAATVRLP